MAEKFLFISESAIEGYQNQIPDAGRDSTFLQKPFIKAACEVFSPTSTTHASRENMTTAVQNTVQITCAAFIDTGNTNELCGIVEGTCKVHEQISDRAMEFDKVLTTLNDSGGCR
ncbi:hypothetical protein M4A92_07475 [Caldibacillus thermoamylovorans]|uniref:hypothetical protein n=1 Tax=Caldibacillus thermoamylovorans TaxID=35841 RepID=UPI00203CBA1F|nr:hypothetical protein [Caldibacillus thermoamylovorans]MCM3798493.1 hypothetical protein [Caldibacillus thermoamylovorans]